MVLRGEIIVQMGDERTARFNVKTQPGTKASRQGAALKRLVRPRECVNISSDDSSDFQVSKLD